MHYIKNAFLISFCLLSCTIKAQLNGALELHKKLNFQSSNYCLIQNRGENISITSSCGMYKYGRKNNTNYKNNTELIDLGILLMFPLKGNFIFLVILKFWQAPLFKIGVIIILNIIIFRFYLKKSKSQKILDEMSIAKLELQAVKTQLTPHFIYNCLNSIQYLNYKKDNEFIAVITPIFEKRKKEIVADFLLHKEENEKEFFFVLESYIHMTLNRLFLQDPRKHEMIIYNYLYRFYKSAVKRTEYKKKLKND